MNKKSLIITIIVAAISVWATDFLIHAVWLGQRYGETKELWRTEAEMMKNMPFMFCGQILVGASFATLFALFVAEKRCLGMTLTFSALIGGMTGAGQIIMYAVQPLPGDIVIKWCAAYLVQALVVGAIVHLVYKPNAAAAACCASGTASGSAGNS